MVLQIGLHVYIIRIVKCIYRGCLETVTPYTAAGRIFSLNSMKHLESSCCAGDHTNYRIAARIRGISDFAT